MSLCTHDKLLTIKKKDENQMTIKFAVQISRNINTNKKNIIRIENNLIFEVNTPTHTLELFPKILK